MATKARILPRSENGIKEAGRVLASGGLVAFPTETVYGLGANALNEAAVLRIFETKGRPLTDPLIVHVASKEAALKLVQLNEVAQRVFERLTDVFWPGPLTLIASARPELPDCLSAGTKTLGVRCPSHPLARKLLQVAAIPVAAPSANLFGHVSPTTARHVLDDLGHTDIFILDGESIPHDDNDIQYDLGSCHYGIESTVCKLENDDQGLVVRIFRRGAVATSDLTAALEEYNDVHVRDGIILSSSSEGSQPIKDDDNIQTPRVSPGQLLTHYAPRLPAVLTRLANDGISQIDLSAAVIVDFNCRLAPLKTKVLAYRDIASDGDAVEAAACLFSTLRWAENVPGAERVLIADLSSLRTGTDLLAGVADRLYRAASGKQLSLSSSP